ncbi:MAG TPA: transketolase C-terminal domain-containing protein [bacterium]|nr:transketolase C-terminal domain-containing protein [bacterium]
MRNEFIKRLEALTEKDPRLLFITGDLGFGVIENLAKRFPKQYLNVGVAEQNMIGVATGLALEGRIAVAYSIGNFPTLRCLEQIRNDAAYHGANVKVVCVGGGFSYGSLGFSHHATEDLSILRALPGLTVVAPGDLWEAGEATEAVIRAQGTCYLRLDKSSAGWTNRPGEKFELGRARLLREGNDATIIAAGGILAVALSGAEKLAAQGIQCRVLSMHTIKPLDTEAILGACRETGGIVTLEEHVVEGGLGGAVAETCLEEENRPKFFHRMGLRGGFATIVGNQDYLREKHSMDEKSLVAKVADLVARGRERRPQSLATSR